MSRCEGWYAQGDRLVLAIVPDGFGSPVGDVMLIWRSEANRQGVRETATRAKPPRDHAWWTQPQRIGNIPRRRPGAGLGATLEIDYAADYAGVSSPEVADRRSGTLSVDDEEIAGEYITYAFAVTYEGDGPEVDRLPMDVTTPQAMEYVSSTLTASRLERRGRVASYENVTPGALGYVFRNYVRVFGEVRAPGTGESLFLAWIRNSFVFAFFRIIVTLMICSMAGYALARLTFPGSNMIFLLVLFSQMIPLQVLFISNYLVLRDGIWGLSSLWGQETLLNSLTGLIWVTALNAGGVSS